SLSWTRFILPLFACFPLIGFVLFLMNFLREVWCQISDWMSLRRLVIPNQVHRPWVYLVCSSLKTSAGRLRFLENLRLRGVEGTDELSPQMADQLWIDDRVQEGL